MEIKGNMSFWERLVNFCEVWMQMYNWMNVRIPTENALVRQYLGEDTPSVMDITKNMSLYLVNKKPALSIVRQEQPNVVFFHGLHIAATPPALPKVFYVSIRNSVKLPSRKVLMA